jgi:excisionase family DNA binding protein
VTSGVTDRAPSRPDAQRHSQTLLTVGKNYSGAGANSVQDSPAAPSVTSVTVPFAALVLPGLEQSECSYGIVAGGAERFLSVREVGCRLGVCRATVYKLVSIGTLRSVRVGHAIRVRLSDVIQLMVGSI